MVAFACSKALRAHHIHVALKVESLLRDIIQFAVQNHLEALNGFFQGDVLTRHAGEDFRYEERL
jgi:hypothetical protein